MGIEDDKKTLFKIMELIRGTSVLLLLIHMYLHCPDIFKNIELSSVFIDKLIINLDTAFNRLISNPIKCKFSILLLLALSSIGRGKSDADKCTSWPVIILFFIIGLSLFFISPYNISSITYSCTLIIGYLLITLAIEWGSRILNPGIVTDDIFNTENESFPQEEKLIENEYSVNLPTRYYYKGKYRKGWINVINPFRASIVLGTPGSGKSFSIINSYIRQHISKGFAMYIYDYKFPDLSEIAYNNLIKYANKYKVTPKFYVINFDDPKHSNRCNPIDPRLMTDIADAYESAYTIMLNLNRTWISKQGDFFVESPIILLAATIWFLKIYENGKYCTFPHAIEFLNREYELIFTILTSYPELENYMSPFIDAWKGGAADQLQGQIASAKIPLSRLISPQLYWVMSKSEFSMDINNPKEPKILVVGNNPDRQNIYGAALGLYNIRITKLINKKNMLHSGVIIDELPTIYFKGLDNLIATARSNKVAVCLGFQDFSQLTRDYGEKEANVVVNTVGNIFSGQVVGTTAAKLQDRFGRVVQQTKSITRGQGSSSTSFNTHLDYLIPQSKIANLSQGDFVGAVSDNYGEKITQKIFHAEILVDRKVIDDEKSNFQPIPVLSNFIDNEGNDNMNEIIYENYLQIKEDVKRIVDNEIKRLNINTNEIRSKK